MLIDICIKFREYSLNGFQVIERTRFVTEGQTDGRPGKNNMSPDPKGGRRNEGQKYCRMLPLEQSAILLTCIKQYLVFKTNVQSF